ILTHTHADAANCGTVDHGATTGLTDDDHTQYLKEDASGGTAAETPDHTHADATTCGTIVHGALTGLTDFDHTAIKLGGPPGLTIASGVITVIQTFHQIDTEGGAPSDFLTTINGGVEGMMVSPGYSYQKAPNQGNFLQREKTKQLFRKLLAKRKKKWAFNLSPNFLHFLQGNIEYKCTPWGTPTYNIFGWQKPCYLLQEGYTDSFQQLMTETDWAKYGHHTGNPECRDCMVHCGYEPSSVDDTFSSVAGMVRTIRSILS
ncbi:MAG: DUF3463 domain-containing protein, partial [bacterium]